ncbi:hypothetical protein N1851_033882 [Merluccius polli]|uniref:Uncharacterized protein n=1 Tax=Merluccius polli TaxID=89951 RepID=A0AA47M0L2_MERPO|nr:hypothetical protein N1851_033882 [Merluccius polli]
MNYCMSDVYEVSHGDMGGYFVSSGEEYCMYPAEAPGFGHCEPQALHHPPCMEQAWPHSQHYSCSYTPVFKSEFCSMEIPLSNNHHVADYFSGAKSDFSHLQWIQGDDKRGMARQLIGESLQIQFLQCGFAAVLSTFTFLFS